MTVLRPTQPDPTEDEGSTPAGVFTAQDHQEMITIAHDHADYLEAHQTALDNITNSDSILDFIAALDAALT